MHLPPFENHGADPLAFLSFGSAMTITAVAPAPSPDLHNAQELMRSIFRSPRLSLQQVERLGGSLNCLYLLRLIDGRSFVLKCPPNRHTALLRHEQHSQQDESSILKLITSAPEIPVPQVVHKRSHGGSFGPYLLRTFIPGSRLAELSHHLTSTQRVQIDRKIGYLIRRITTSTAGTYGASAPVFAGEGQQSWREAFHHLLESILRDAEDMLVTIPYESIRAHFYKQQSLLGAVKSSQLVPMRSGLPHTVIIDDLTKEVTGLLGLSDVLWGDPMLSPVFAKASPAFWEGYGLCPARNGDERVRNLLYTMYRALVQLVSNHYRPIDDNMELDARRSLTWALNELDIL